MQYEILPKEIWGGFFTFCPFFHKMEKGGESDAERPDRRTLQCR